MSEVKVNKISPRTNCGTVQLGDSGDTITIPSGATITNNGTQTGFGRTGTVNWDTTVKTSAFTAVSGEGYFCNTSSAAFTVTLPASPSAGDIVSFADYTRTFNTNNLTLGRNSQPIGGIAADGILNINGQSATFIYIDSTEGWINVNESTGNTGAIEYMSATGGTITTCGDFKIHTFTSPGTFTVTASTVDTDRNKVGYLVVAGGGSGGVNGAGGGGAGGLREGRCATAIPYTASPLVATTGITVTSQGYPITVGAGGASATHSACSNVKAPGSNSIFSTITSTGGGGGGTGGGNPSCTGNNPVANNLAGDDGGSGGGAHDQRTNPAYRGSGNTPPVSPSQGNPGGNGVDFPPAGGGGGGGAGGSGVSATSPGTGPSPSNKGGNGGAGVTSSISGSSLLYSAGGGGGIRPGGSGGGDGGSRPSPRQGGSGAPHPSPDTSGATGQSGVANTGGGGGGGSNNTGTPASGAGGSGVVVIRYKFQ